MTDIYSFMSAGKYMFKILSKNIVALYVFKINRKGTKRIPLRVIKWTFPHNHILKTPDDLASKIYPRKAKAKGRQTKFVTLTHSLSAYTLIGNTCL